MLSNEQRAHDIVMSLLPTIVAEQRVRARETALANSTQLQSVNVTKIYLQSYKDSLKTLEDSAENV